MAVKGVDVVAAHPPDDDEESFSGGRGMDIIMGRLGTCRCVAPSSMHSSNLII